MKEEKKRKVKGHYGVYFLVFIVVVYLFLFLFKPEEIQNSLKATGDLLIQIVPIFLLVIFFMGITNYFILPKTVSKYLGKESGTRGWMLAVSAGVLSHGPVYAWYPLLKELRRHGMRSGLLLLSFTIGP